MCAIIGIYTDKFNQTNQLLLKELLIQSRIRGKHATGISYYSESKFDSELFTLKQSISSDIFVKCIDFNEISSSVIGHCRYSTSDLNYNQPIDNGIDSIVHNGIITQSDPESWKQKFGYSCEGKNDSELIIRCIDENKEPLIVFKESSLAVIHLRQDNSLLFYRNKFRPIWYVKYENSYYIGSTEDILNRTFKKALNIGINPEKCLSGYRYIVNSSGLSKYNLLQDTSDLQLKLSCTDYYINGKDN